MSEQYGTKDAYIEREHSHPKKHPRVRLQDAQTLLICLHIVLPSPLMLPNLGRALCLPLLPANADVPFHVLPHLAYRLRLQRQPLCLRSRLPCQEFVPLRLLASNSNFLETEKAILINCNLHERTFHKIPSCKLFLF